MDGAVSGGAGMLPGKGLSDVNSLLMPLNHWVREHVAEVHFAPLPQHLGVFLLHQPADMSEEEAPLHVVWVRVCLGELVVHPVVAYPLHDGVLETIINNHQRQHRRRSRDTFLIVYALVVDMLHK